MKWVERHGECIVSIVCIEFIISFYVLYLIYRETVAFDMESVAGMKSRCYNLTFDGGHIRAKLLYWHAKSY